MATHDIPAGEPFRPLGHAVVVGGSMAGLLAARVLADHFERVTLVERDALPAVAAPRKGVPQGSHVHVLLVRGRMIVEALFPGLADELRAAGAVALNGGRDLAWHARGGWRVRHASDLVFLSMSRPLLEARVAARLGGLANVRTLDRTRVLAWRSDGRRGVTGVRVEACGPGGAGWEIEADLVVDATGRGSAAAERLTDLGFDAPPTDSLPTRVGYASCTFRRPPGDRGWRALIISGAPARRSGLVFPVEGDRWLLTLSGFFDEAMPSDHEGVLAFARSLAVSDLHEALREAEPVSAIARYRFAGNFRHRYERLDRLPEGLIATGDAVCSFNPIYAQGMTVAAVEAELLGQALGRARRRGGIDPDFGRRWFRAIAPVIDGAWNGVSLEDLRFPELAHQRPVRLRPLQWYMARVGRATHRSALVADRFYRVINFLDPPTALFRPRVLAEALLGGSLGRATGATWAADHSGTPAIRSASM